MIFFKRKVLKIFFLKSIFFGTVKDENLVYDSYVITQIKKFKLKTKLKGLYLKK